MFGRNLNVERPLNMSHPLNYGLVSEWACVPGTPFFGGGRMLDLRWKYHGTLTGGPPWGGSMGLNFTTTGQYANCGSVGPWVATAANLTVTAVCIPSTGAGSSAFNGIRNIITAASDASGLMQFALRTENTASWVMVVYDGSYYNATATLTRVVGRRYYVVGTYGVGRGVQIYVWDDAGNYATASTSGPATAANASPSPLRIGGSAEDSGNRQWLGAITSASYATSYATSGQASEWTRSARLGNPNRYNWLPGRSWIGTATAAAGVKPWWSWASQRVINVGGTI